LPQNFLNGSIFSISGQFLTIAKQLNEAKMKKMKTLELKKRSFIFLTAKLNLNNCAV